MRLKFSISEVLSSRMNPSFVFLLCLVADVFSYTPTPATSDLKNVGFKVPNFDASADAETLHHALHAANVPTVVQVLTHKTYGERIDIAHKFKAQYGKSLKEELVKHVGDEMIKDILVALVLKTPFYYATELHKAMDGVGTNEKVLIYILCSMTNHEMQAVMNAYETEFQHKLIDDVKGDTSGDFENFLVTLLHANRDESSATNKDHALIDAQELHKAGLDRIGTDEKVFYEILCTRNFEQLRIIFDKYKHVSGHDIEYAISKEFSGYAKEGLLALVSATRNLSGYFAKCLDSWLSDKDEKNGALIRIVVTRSEVDMGYIKKEYEATYHKSLETEIAAHTKGLYKDAILNLLGHH